jgi:hypothetical protein
VDLIIFINYTNAYFYLMKNLVRSFLYLIIIILVLEVIKTLVAKAGGSTSFFTGFVLASVQMFILTGFVLFSLIFLLCRKRITPPRKAVAVSLLLSLIIIACLEGLFAIGLHNPQRIPAFLYNAYDYYYNTYDRKIIQYNAQASVYDPKLFYTLKPNAHFNYINAEFDNPFSTNSMGVRDDENSLYKPAIICLGDSYTMGWGADQDSTYPQQLEKISGQKALNGGVSSYGTAREIINLGRFNTSALTHLIIQYYDNDYEENIGYINNKRHLVISPRSLFERTVKSEGYNSIYYPGKYFLNVSQIYIKQTIQKVAPVFAFKIAGNGAEVTDIKHAKLFLDVFSDAPVDFSKVKTIVFYPGKDLERIKAFETLTDSLLQVSPYKERFHGNIKILRVTELLQPSDYYMLDVHLTNKGHRKLAEGLWNMMQGF